MIYLLYFFSGLTALIYEVVWAKRLSYVVGADAYAIALVLSIFFTGLAAGSYFFGKLKFNSKPLFIYGLIELSIGLYALLTPAIFKFLEGNFFGGQLWLVYLFAFISLIIPAIFMGGTFPLIVSAVNDAKKVGYLYGINTIGAVFGTLLSGFLLVRYFGINGSILISSAINILVAIAALNFSRKTGIKELQLKNVKFKLEKDVDAEVSNKKILTVLFLTGLASLSLEVLWTRVLILSFGPSTYAFSVVLASFLVGIGIGSLVASKLLNWSKFASLMLLILGIVTVVISPSLGGLPKILIENFLKESTDSYGSVLFATGTLSFLFLIVPTFLMGISFVYLLNLLTKGISDKPLVGKAYALNTVGGVIGSLAAGFLLIPLLGIQKSIIITSLVFVLCALIIEENVRRKVAITAILLIVFALFSFFPTWNKHILTSGVFVYFRDYLQDSENFESLVSAGEILFYKEGLLSTVMVKKAPEGFLFLRNNGKADASTDQDLDDMHLIGSLPLILHPNPRRVFVIGMGSGITAGSVAAHPVEIIEVGEIERAVIDAASYFGEYNNNILRDPRLKIINTDARNYLEKANKKYDVITSQPSNLWVSGNSSLFTREFFEIGKSRLSDDGLMLQWIPFYGLDNQEFKTAIKTFASVFPEVTVWTPVVSHDILLVGSKTPQEFNLDDINNKLTERVKNNLSEAQIKSPEVLLAHYLFDQRQIEGLMKDPNVPLHTDDKPILEYSSPFSLYKNSEKGNLEYLLGFKGEWRGHLIKREELNHDEVSRAKESVDLILGAKIKIIDGDLVEAANDLERALLVLPKNGTKKELARVYFELAKGAFERNDISGTISYFEKSVTNYPNARVYLNLSLLYLQQGRRVKASEAYLKAQALEPQNPRLQEIKSALDR